MDLRTPKRERVRFMLACFVVTVNGDGLNWFIITVTQLCMSLVESVVSLIRDIFCHDLAKLPAGFHALEFPLSQLTGLVSRAIISRQLTGLVTRVI
ncbi:hypothetical protein G9A89_011322 [Geosiphon pyriformis]|nr:hypothetical protein G9A89_011322 [Geosiphon pyriformis]